MNVTSDPTVALAAVAAARLGLAIAPHARAEPLDLADGEHILNLSAREFGSLRAGKATHPVDFPAGDYVISIITPVITSDTQHDDAVFTAWSHAFGNVGTWHTGWRAWRDDEDEGIFIIGGQFTGADAPADALAATVSERLVTPLTLEEPAMAGETMTSSGHASRARQPLAVRVEWERNMR